jgi:hypothetical protein
MTGPRRLPVRGDVAASVVAEVLGLSLADSKARQSALRERGFPEPDPTTGLYCIEAVDRWRMRRHPRLFPKLASAPTAAHAGVAVFDERLGPFDCRPVVDALRANGSPADRVSPCDIVAPSIGRDLRVNPKAEADGFSELYSCLGRPDVQIVKVETLLVVRTPWPLKIATRASR